MWEGGFLSRVSKWLRRRLAAQARTERVSRSLKGEPVPAPVIAAAKRARRAVALISVTFYSWYSVDVKALVFWTEFICVQ